MKKILFISVAACSLLIGCNNRKSNISEIQSTDDSPIVATSREDVVIPASDDVVELNLIDGKGSVIIQKNERQNVYIEFTSNGFKKLRGHLSSLDSNANIRFSQIIMTNNQMDGPFGRDIEYDLPADGTYRLSVNENQMAGDPWGGVFKVEIELTK